MLEKAIYPFILVSSDHTYKVIIYSNIAIKSKMPIAQCNYNPTGTSIFAETWTNEKTVWKLILAILKIKRKQKKY